ncbi:uncharacterized protein [Rutidosis leptorrhynchoides]|uniref:uncharacterized protein n=1 Tax=Rutidosis leptorrhynchoides TaxID=125765 RepID=UPI003A992FAE
MTSLAISLLTMTTRVLSSRNIEIELASVKLSVRHGFRQAFVQTVIDYAYSHNVQKMTIKWLDIMCLELPISLFMSQSVKDFTFIGPTSIFNQPKINSSLDLPALTTLHLENVTISNKNCAEYGGVFSKCPNLNNLTLFKCDIDDPNNFIRHSEFSKLKPETGLYSYANVVVPHVKNLTVVDCRGRLMLYAPELSSLIYAVVEILQGFHNAKFLTLALEIFEVPSFEREVSGLPSPFGNLMSLKIYPRRLDREKNVKKVKIPKQVRNFLLAASPNASVSIYSREEMKALKDATSAQRMMAKFQLDYFRLILSISSLLIVNVSTCVMEHIES